MSIPTPVPQASQSFTQALIAHIKALRPHQWVKNVFVVAPLVFSGQFFSQVASVSSAWAFFGFCLCASSIYLINDTVDYKRDQAHPKKRLRPIARGDVKRSVAIPLAAICMACGFWIGYRLNQATMGTLVAYVMMNIAYSLGLKHIFLVDVFFIAFGFLLRVSVGAFAIEVSLSPWLLLCTLFIALFLGLCKRRHERSSLGEEATKHRSLLASYSLPFLDQLILITASATLMSYALYTIDPFVCQRLSTNGLILTLPLVLFGIFRYLGLVYQRNEGGSPTQVVLKDRGIQLILAIYLLACVTLIQQKIQLELMDTQNVSVPHRQSLDHSNQQIHHPVESDL